jgi:hypothetical protein
VLEAGQQQVVRLAGIGGQGRGVGLEILEIEFLNPQFVLFQTTKAWLRRSKVRQIRLPVSPQPQIR